MTQTFRQLQNLPTGVKVPQETRLFEILTCACARKNKVHARWQYTQQTGSAGHAAVPRGPNTTSGQVVRG